MTVKEELEIKLGRLRNLMRERKLSAVYIKRQDNFAWLSCGGKNYVGIGDMGNCGLLVTAESRYAITNNIEAPRMAGEEGLEELGFAVHAGTWHDGNFEAETIKKLAGSGAALGLDFASPLGAGVAEEIKQLRFSLTESELERYRETGYLVSLSLEETAASIRPGESEFEILGRLSESLVSHGLVFYSGMCAADERISRYRHPIATDRRVRERVQLGGNFGRFGLIACLTRYVNFTPVSAELRRQMRLNQEIDLVFMKNSVPGKSYQHPFLAGREAYAVRGFGDEFDRHHQGGPIGYTPRDYRVDFSHGGIIQENQGFCWNPSITGTKSEDTIVAKPEGFEFITRPVIFPKAELSVDGKTYIRADILEK
ncbi:MAG: aminopeptidase P family N-terminal domain-containing protein [Treponema sp.]|jgi:Xaa-Pro aminopeptidase|nr:aminopeptidase P family N-terminal domain-containing protein [Treponema sp.]